MITAQQNLGLFDAICNATPLQPHSTEEQTDHDIQIPRLPTFQKTTQQERCRQSLFRNDHIPNEFLHLHTGRHVEEQQH